MNRQEPKDARSIGLMIALTAILFGLTGCAAAPIGLGSGTATTSAAVSATIPVGPGPILLAMSNDGTHLYAAGNNGLHVIDTGTQAITASLSTAPNPAGLTLSGGNWFVFLTNLFSPQLTVINTNPPGLADPIQLLGGPTRPAYGRVASTRDGGTAYVLDEAGNNLVVVDVAQSSPTSMQLDLAPRDIVLSPDGRWAYICGCHGFCTPGAVQPFDTQSGQFGERFQVGSAPYRIVTSPDGKTLYTANLGDGSVSVVDAASRTLTGSIQVAPQLTDLKVSRDGKWIYVVSRAAGQLAVIDASTAAVHATMSIGPAPREVVLSPDGKRAYVSTENSVAVVETATLLAGG